MKRLLFSALLGGCAVGASAQPAAPDGPYTVPATALHRLDSLYHYLDTSGLYNGVLLVASGGKRVSGAAIGYADLATKARLTEAAPFELASVSKQFTAVGVLTLVQAGKLQLDQPLLSIFPTLPYTGVTIRQLLNHTAGLPDYMELVQQQWNRKRIATNADVVALLSRYHPAQEFQAGAKWAYSNTGYALLAAVIEKVSGRSYAQYLQEAVFGPLGLTHTFVYTRRYAPRAVPGYAYGYVRDSTGAYRLPDSLAAYDYVRYLDGITGDGTVNSTAGDLLRWNNAIRDGKLLTPGLWKEALRPAYIDGGDTHYGFGFEVTTSPTYGRILSHTGGWPGYQTKNVLYLDRDVSLIYLSNKEADEAVLSDTWDAVRDLTFGRPARFPVPLHQVAAQVAPAVFTRYTGTYEATEQPGFELRISVRNGALLAQATGQGIIPLTPESETVFFVEGAPIKLEFVPDGAGPAKRLVLHQGGDHPFVRKGD